jgi:hypothetical protein
LRFLGHIRDRDRLQSKSVALSVPENVGRHNPLERAEEYVGKRTARVTGCQTRCEDRLEFADNRGCTIVLRTMKQKKGASPLSLKQSTFGERKSLRASDYEMIEYPDVDQRQRLL